MSNGRPCHANSVPKTIASEVSKEEDLNHQLQRQSLWAVAGDKLTDANESRVSEILNEIQRMEVSTDLLAERAKSFKEKLDALEEEGGIVLEMGE